MRDLDVVYVFFGAIISLVLYLAITPTTPNNPTKDFTPCETKAQKPTQTLPQKCASLYDPGNTDINSPWKQCMGVGPK